jgi:hypothetical protein
VPGPLGDLGGLEAPVEPCRDASVLEVVDALGQRRRIFAGTQSDTACLVPHAPRPFPGSVRWHERQIPARQSPPRPAPKAVLVSQAGDGVVSTVHGVRTVPSEYWLAVATTVPILALALVLEAREIVRRWNTSTPRLWRTVLSVLWAVPLLGFVVTEYYALKALRGEVAPSWLPPLGEVAITVAMLILVLVPAIDFFLVRAQAELLARVLALSPIPGLNGWRLRRNLARTSRGVTKAAADTRKIFESGTRKLDELTEATAQLVANGVSVEDVEAVRTGIKAARAELERRRGEFESILGDRATYFEKYQGRRSELKNTVRAISKVKRKAINERLLPGPNSNANREKLMAELREISNSLTGEADSAAENAGQPAERDDG